MRRPAQTLRRPLLRNNSSIAPRFLPLFLAPFPMKRQRGPCAARVADKCYDVLGKMEDKTYLIGKSDSEHQGKPICRAPACMKRGGHWSSRAMKRKVVPTEPPLDAALQVPALIPAVRSGVPAMLAAPADLPFLEQPMLGAKVCALMINLGLPAAGPLPAQIRAANSMMQFEASGSLLEQVERLIKASGTVIAIHSPGAHAVHTSSAQTMHTSSASGVHVQPQPAAPPAAQIAASEPPTPTVTGSSGAVGAHTVHTSSAQSGADGASSAQLGADGAHTSSAQSGANGEHAPSAQAVHSSSAQSGADGADGAHVSSAQSGANGAHASSAQAVHTSSAHSAAQSGAHGFPVWNEECGEWCEEPPSSQPHDMQPDPERTQEEREWARAAAMRYAADKERIMAAARRLCV